MQVGAMRKPGRLFHRLLLPLIVLGIGITAGSVLAADYIIVVHRDNPVSRLSQEEVKRIFLGKLTTWPDATPITIVMNTNDEIHEKFTRNVLHKSSVQLSVYWRKIRYSGGGMLPLAVKDDEAAKSFIGYHKNAIGYISPDSLDRQVKRIEIR
jgi:ABC-type phosphate transport system substrate-binding protein